MQLGHDERFQCHQVVFRVITDERVGSAVRISSLYDLENDEEELQGEQSIYYVGLHRNVKQGVKYTRCPCLHQAQYSILSIICQKECNHSKR